MTAAEAARFFGSMPMHGIKPGLEATSLLMRRAGNPERNLRFIHIAGTNGKGSTGAMLECALRKAGLTTGFYTSPHLIDVRERFRVNGRAIPEENFGALVSELLNEAKYGTPEACPFTYFEFATVLAAKIFERAGVDVVIWETGMGGRLDSTNVVHPAAAVITNIALDHQKFLGNTISEIAAEKGGIIKAGVPLFTGVMPEEALSVLRKIAAEKGAEVFPPAPEERGVVSCLLEEQSAFQQFESDGRRIRLPLLGAMQRRNFRIVRQVLGYFAPRWNFNLALALDGLRAVRWPARCQRLCGDLIVDGGHNPDGLAALREALSELFPEEKFSVIFAGFRDKDVSGSLNLISPLAAEFLFVPLHEADRPCWSGKEMMQMLPAGIPAREMTDAVSAVNAARREKKHRVLAAGSLFLAGEVLKNFADPHTVLDLD